MSKDIKVFSENIDPAALHQFHEAMAMPFAVKGAVMPDAHKGYSLPIGGVVATDGVVVPAWVGYDIGCTDKDTEYLTREGWKKISDYDGEEIMQYDKVSNVASFSHPQRYVINDCEEFYHLDNGVVDQMLTEDHKLLLFSSKNDTYAVDGLTSDWIKKNNSLSKGVTHQFKTDIPSELEEGVGFTTDELRLIVAISADGCIRSSGKVEFHLKKDRKIKRLKSHLKQLGITYNEYEMQDDTFGCSFYFDKATKDLSFLWAANPWQLCFVAFESRFWDGHTKPNGTVTYSTTDRGNADLIQYAWAVNETRANIQVTEYPDNPDWNTGYTVYTTKNHMVSFPKPKDIKKVPSVDGKSYCFTTNTGYWVMRRNGKIVVTGNCGVCALQTDLTREEVAAKADDLFKYIQESVPVGRAVHKEEASFAPAKCLSEAGKEVYKRRNGAYQLGTLGGGNHFIEIGYDELDKVWIIIHSGSRGFGHGLAEHYMKVASGSDKAREGHFALGLDSPEGRNYMKDQKIALMYAVSNRAGMMETVFQILCSTVRKVPRKYDMINRNHNHAVEKDGLVIHRKGATHAEEGMMGVIPGNMRDGAFIVQGLGNKDSLCSSSHGAGRVLGRMAAKKKLDLGEFLDSMQGITSCASKYTLDEAPAAYKDIFQVMRDQKDLVAVMAHVKPIINVKG